MVRLDNRKTIQDLTNQFIKTYKKNTLTITLTITLLLTLVISLFTLIHTNHWIEAMQNQFIYTNIDYQISGLNHNQIQLLKDNHEIDKLGVKRIKATIGTDYQHATVIAANQPSILITSTLLSGNMPTTANEVVAEKWALLNLGINPAIGEKFTFDTTFLDSNGESQGTQPVTYKIVGILNDIPLNKLSGSLMLYTDLNESREKDSIPKDYIAEIKFKDGVNTGKAIQNIETHLKVPPKSVSPNPWHENKKELSLIDYKIGLLLLLICFVIVWGIYRISLAARESQYGTLRAVGVTKKQIRDMIRSELLKLYMISIPLGILLGTIISNAVTVLSQNNKMSIYFWGKKETFKIIYPIVPIIIGILGIGAVLILISLLGSRKVNNQTIMGAITGTSSKNIHTLALLTIGEKSHLFLSQKFGAKYIFCKLGTSIIIILSLAVGGVLFYGLSYKATLSSAETTIKTEESFYNSDYILTANDDMSAVKGIKKNTLKQAKKIPEITGTETQMAMPVKVIEDGTGRIDQYFTDENKIVQRNYGFPLENSFGTDTFFHTKLKGYNTAALEKLKKYLVEGDFNPQNIKSDEIIIAMPRMSTYGKSEGITGFFKNGIPIMQYKPGQQITVKYRSDFLTASSEYWNGTDNINQYSTVDYKVAAIVYYPYMEETSVIEQVSPLLITSEKNYTHLNPAGVYETVNLSIHDNIPKQRQNEIEQELIALSVKNQQVTARSLIDEKAKLNMMYRKSLVYIYGIAIVVFILILLHLINSLKYRIQTRKTELYIYRSIGMDFKFQAKMIQFENMVFGVISLLISLFISHGIAYWLYVDSGIYVYGIAYNYNYLIFAALAVFTLVICYVVSRILCVPLKDEDIVSELNRIE